MFLVRCGPLPVTVLVPVKSTSRGKSRLLLPAAARRQVVRAMALDTVAAVSRVARVVVVAEDPDDLPAFERLAHSRIRTYLTATAGLNEAIRDGLSTVGGGRVASLPADLPGLRPADLREALMLAQDLDLAVVADRQGIGTTLLVARRPEFLVPRYGGESLAAHLASGAVQLAVPAGSSLREDVDVPADLSGRVGPRLAVALRRTGLIDDGEPADIAS